MECDGGSGRRAIWTEPGPPATGMSGSAHTRTTCMNAVCSSPWSRDEKENQGKRKEEKREEFRAFRKPATLARIHVLLLLLPSGSIGKHPRTCTRTSELKPRGPRQRWRLRFVFLSSCIDEARGVPFRFSLVMQRRTFTPTHTCARHLFRLLARVPAAGQHGSSLPAARLLDERVARRPVGL